MAISNQSQIVFLNTLLNESFVIQIEFLIECLRSLEPNCHTRCSSSAAQCMEVENNFLVTNLEKNHLLQIRD